MDLIQKSKYINNEYLKVHNEGYGNIKNVLMWLLIINGVLFFLQLSDSLFVIVNILSIVLFLFVTYSFRKPKREVIDCANTTIVSPSDGVVSDISEFNGNLKITIKQTILDANIIQVPLNGSCANIDAEPKLLRNQEHPKQNTYSGKVSIEIKSDSGNSVVMNMVPGVFSNNVYCNAEKSATCTIGENLGLIYFGGKVELLLPLNSKLLIAKNKKVKANLTQVALL